MIFITKVIVSYNLELVLGHFIFLSNWTLPRPDQIISFFFFTRIFSVMGNLIGRFLLSNYLGEENGIFDRKYSVSYRILSLI